MHLPNIQTREEALALLSLPYEELIENAWRIRKEVFGNTIELCAIINAKSGNCSMNCAFCSQSAVSNTDAPKHPLLSKNALLDRIHALSALPLAHIGIVTSGGALPDRDVDTICQVLSELSPDIRRRLCASLGRLSEENLTKLVWAGLRQFHHNLESSASFYPSVCTSQTWQDRLKTVLCAGKAGLINCTGGLFGMGESWADRIDLALTLKAHNIRHIPINFLHPHKNTPLAQMSIPNARTAHTIIALFRHILPMATLRLCGGRPTSFAGHEHEVLCSGANALMTGDYLTTHGMQAEQDLALLSHLGLTPAMDTTK
ncbi:MAG: biotin synthase BioB [Desulfovibrionaceae bacterium]|nr:biotin synthase BioB [Desulfovibrionaceae bacterium]